MASTFDPAASAAASHGRGRAFGLGPRVLLAAAAVVALALLAVVLTRAGGSPAAHRRAASSAGAYGGIPSWLPKSKVRVDRVVQASLARPALAVEGDTVAIGLPSGHTLVTAVGPEVPEEGRVPVPASSPCTFIVTFAQPSGAIALSPAAFVLVDEYGDLHHPRVSAVATGKSQAASLPRRLPSGRSTSLRLSAVLPTGSGSLVWAPVGGRPLVTWDFSVEID